jgi:hypothetical protein
MLQDPPQFAQLMVGDLIACPAIRILQELLPGNIMLVLQIGVDSVHLYLTWFYSISDGTSGDSQGKTQAACVSGLTDTGLWRRACRRQIAFQVNFKLVNLAQTVKRLDRVTALLPASGSSTRAFGFRHFDAGTFFVEGAAGAIPGSGSSSLEKIRYPIRTTPTPIAARLM